MTDERTPPSDGRRGITRRTRPRPGMQARPVDAAVRAPNDPAAGADAGADERPVRPWEVAGNEPPASPRDEREQPRTKRRVTVSQLLADVPEDAVIVARRLTKLYGEFPAVSNLDLTIRAGEVFGLLGPNGAGKTTTVLMLLGLTEPTRGVVRVVGMDPTREPLAVKRHVGLPARQRGLLRRPDGPREPALHGEAQRPRAHARPRPASTSCSRRSASSTPPTRRPRPTRAACASGSASRTPW